VQCSATIAHVHCTMYNLHRHHTGRNFGHNAQILHSIKADVTLKLIRPFNLEKNHSNCKN